MCSKFFSFCLSSHIARNHTNSSIKCQGNQFEVLKSVSLIFTARVFNNANDDRDDDDDDDCYFKDCIIKTASNPLKWQQDEKTRRRLTTEIIKLNCCFVYKTSYEWRSFPRKRHDDVFKPQEVPQEISSLSSYLLRIHLISILFLHFSRQQHLISIFSCVSLVFCNTRMQSFHSLIHHSPKDR